MQRTIPGLGGGVPRAERSLFAVKGVFAGGRDAAGGARGGARVGGRRVRSGPGLTCPKCRVQGSSRPRWIPESPLCVAPGPSMFRVELQLSPGGVGHAALQRAEGFFAGLAFGLLAQLVRATGCVVGDLSDGDDVDRVGQRPVPSRVQPVPAAVRARRFDRCGAVVVSELGARPEPPDVRATPRQRSRLANASLGGQPNNTGGRQFESQPTRTWDAKPSPSTPPHSPSGSSALPAEGQRNSQHCDNEHASKGHGVGERFSTGSE